MDLQTTPIKPALQDALRSIGQRFTPVSVTIHRRTFVSGQYRELNMWCEPGTYEISGDTRRENGDHYLMVTPGGFTAIHLQAIGAADVTYLDGHVEAARTYMGCN